MLTPRDRDIVTRTLIGEAIGEGAKGMRAVAHVIANRVNAGFGATPTAVSLAPKQFSAWNKGAGGNKLVYAYGPDSAEYKKALAITDQVFAGGDPDPTGGATFYLNPHGTPKRPPKGAATITIGNHVFYGGDKGPVPPLNVGQTAQGKQMPLGMGRGQIHSGAAVKQLQEQLAAKGYDIGKHGADGVYGKDTANAVRNFEVDNHQWPADSVAGKDVLAALNGSPAYSPGGGVMPPPAYSPGGGEVATPSYAPGGGYLPPDPGLESTMAPSQSYSYQQGGMASPGPAPRPVPTILIGPPTISGAPPPMGPGLPSQSGGVPVANGDRPYATRHNMMAWPGAGQPLDMPPSSVPVASTRDFNAPEYQPVEPAQHYPLTGDMSLNDVWEHVKDIPGAWGRLLGIGPDQAPAASPASLYDKVPPAVSAPTQAPNDLTPWGPGFGQQSSAGGFPKVASSSGLNAPTFGPSIVSPSIGDPIWGQPSGEGVPPQAETLPLSSRAFPEGTIPKGAASGSIEQPGFLANYLFSAGGPVPEATVTPGFLNSTKASPGTGDEYPYSLPEKFNAPGQMHAWDYTTASADPNFMPDFNGNIKPDINGDFMTPWGGNAGFNQPIADDFINQLTSIGIPRDLPRADASEIGMPWGALPARYNDPGYVPVTQPNIHGGSPATDLMWNQVDRSFPQVASAGSAWDPRAPAVSGNAPLGRKGDLLAPPSASPIDMWGPDAAAASEAPMFNGQPITDPTLSGIVHFGSPSIAPAGGAPSIAPYQYGSGDAAIGGGMGGGVSSLFQPLPAPDLTISPAGNPNDRTVKAVQAIQQASSGFGGAGQGGGMISPSSYGGGSNGYGFSGFSPWGSATYGAPYGQTGYSNSPFTPSGWTAPSFNSVSGGPTYSYHSNGDGTGYFLNSNGDQMPY